MSAATRALGWGFAVAVIVLGLTAAGTFGFSEARLNQRLDVPLESIGVPTDIGTVQRGQHLAGALARCPVCHGSNLAGGMVLDDAGLGRIAAPNLTRGRGGLGQTRSDADLDRAIRHGVDPNGRALWVMPANDFNRLADADLAAIIAYVRSVAPIDAEWPRGDLRPLGRLRLVLGQVDLQPALGLDHGSARTPPPVAGPTPEYGEYLVRVGGCPDCHGANLGGGSVPLASRATPRAPDLTRASLGTWAEADFLRAMRTGTRPDGRHLAAAMPWPAYAQLTDDELRAIWRLLQALPPHAEAR